MITVNLRAWVGHPRMNATMRAIPGLGCDGVYSAQDWTLTLSAPVPDLCEKVKGVIELSGMDCRRVEILSTSEEPKQPTKTTADDVAPKEQ